MSAFEMVHQDRVIGKLACFDRLILKGHLARFNAPGRLKSFLDNQGVLLKDFDRYVTRTTDAVKAHAQGLAASAGRPYLYLAETHTKSRGQSKEELARGIAERDGVVAGLVCVLRAVEPCSSFSIFRNKATCRLELVRRENVNLKWPHRDGLKWPHPWTRLQYLPTRQTLSVTGFRTRWNGRAQPLGGPFLARAERSR